MLNLWFQLGYKIAMAAVSLMLSNKHVSAYQVLDRVGSEAGSQHYRPSHVASYPEL